MTFEEASSSAVNATALLSAILNDWIVIGHVLYLMPVAAFAEGEESYSPSVEVYVIPDLRSEAKMEIIRAVQPIVDTGVPVTLIWGASSLDRPILNTIH